MFVWVLLRCFWVSFEYLLSFFCVSFERFMTFFRCSQLVWAGLGWAGLGWLAGCLSSWLDCWLGLGLDLAHLNSRRKMTQSWFNPIYQFVWFRFYLVWCSFEFVLLFCWLPSYVLLVSAEVVLSFRFNSTPQNPLAFLLIVFRWPLVLLSLFFRVSVELLPRFHCFFGQPSFESEKSDFEPETLCFELALRTWGPILVPFIC